MWCCNEWQRNLSITGPNSIWPQQFEEHLIMFLSIDPFNSHFRKPISFSSLAFPFHQRNIFLKLNMWTRNNVLKADLDLSNAIISRLWCNNEFSCQIYNQCFSGKTSHGQPHSSAHMAGQDTRKRAIVCSSFIHIIRSDTGNCWTWIQFIAFSQVQHTKLILPQQLAPLPPHPFSQAISNSNPISAKWHYSNRLPYT